MNVPINHQFGTSKILQASNDSPCQFSAKLKGLKFAGKRTENLSALRTELNKGLLRHKMSFSIAWMASEVNVQQPKGMNLVVQFRIRRRKK